jgi:putative FmdB family regulatory protein
MPTYTYQCKNCEHEFDHLQRIADKLLTKCPECGEEALIRLIGGGGGLHFKGSGFYKTDYTKSKHEGSAASHGKGGKKDTKHESKPESKTESKPETSSAKTESSSEKKESPSGKSSESK